MTYIDRVRAFDRWITIEHAGRPDDYAVIDEVLVGNVYRVELGHFKDHDDGKIVVDCGAHIGTFTALAIELGARLVIALEPNLENVAYLERNAKTAEQHRDHCQVRIFRAGIGDGSPVDLLGTGATGQTVPGEQIPTFTLAGILEEVGTRIDYLKLDVEGAEYDWIAAASEEDLRNVNLIRGELHGRGTADRMGKAPVGEFIEKLLHTHSVTAFGVPDTGGIFYAHANEWS